MIAISCPRAGTSSFLPTAMTVAARVSCCWLRVTVSPWALVVLRLPGTVPVTATLLAAWSSHRQVPEPAAPGTTSTATPKAAAPGARSATAPAAARAFTPMVRSPQWLVELGEPQDMAALEGRRAGNEDREGDGVCHLGRFVIPYAAAVTDPG